MQNWLDTAGLHRGVIQLRFDGMTEPAFPKDKQPTIEKVAFADLKKYLPADTPVLTAEMLRGALAARQSALPQTDVTTHRALVRLTSNDVRSG